VKNNVAHNGSLGAGLCCWQSTVFLTDCDISNNSAGGNVNGGGLYCGGSSGSLVAENCLISNNTAEAGGGVFAEVFDYVRLTNCTIAGNRLSAPGTSSGGGIHSVGGDIVIRNSIVWHNDAEAVLLADAVSGNPVQFSDIEGSYSGQGNIDTDPSFASLSMGDYHLKSGFGRYDSRWDRWVTDNEYSPCIDAGDPQNSVGSEPFPHSSRINMGAYGGTAEASKSLGPLIFHVDGTNGNDFNTGLSKSSAFATIQGAVDATLDGDTVVVWPGVYREEVAFKRKAITLQSADEAAVITAPDPITGYAFSFYGAESSRSVLRNFVIINCGKAAIYSESASPTLTNLTIVGNQFGVIAVGGADPSITSCIFWDNKEGDIFQCRAYFSCLQELQALDVEHGNISTDPFLADPAGGDYHLQSRYGRYSHTIGDWVTTDVLTSPCIDAGDPAVYPGRERMPHGGRVNMGAYGGTPFASMSGW
ncbi:MAG: right-handed parallel beta-helix repeat-containing protein, partial [Planctomycetota bacterium]|nr:right-handed parallel beta-helix repeat-containing protein [Planctomycetota bacterium]